MYQVIMLYTSNLSMLPVNHIAIKLETLNKKTPEGPDSKCHLGGPGPQPGSGEERQAPQADLGWDPSSASSQWALGQVLRTQCGPQCDSATLPPAASDRQVGRRWAPVPTHQAGVCCPAYLGSRSIDLSRTRTSPRRSWPCISKMAHTDGCPHPHTLGLEAGRAR